MFKNFKNIILKKQKAIKDEISLKIKIKKIVDRFIKEEILSNKINLESELSLYLKKGIIKIKTNNKIIDQEIVLKLKTLESNLKKEGVDFKKVLI
jgi:hypothetical protein